MLKATLEGTLCEANGKDLTHDPLRHAAQEVIDFLNLKPVERKV